MPVLNEQGMTERMQRIAGRILATNKQGFWPTAAHWVEAAHYCGTKTISDLSSDDMRSNLSPAEKEALTKVLDTAKKWLDIPGLREHAERTLDYWNEPYDKDTPLE